jgi:16S rRNA (cytosine967-C5)-methyltransferase
VRATTARDAAVAVLQAVEAGRGTLASEIDRVRGRLDDARDRALLLELASGTLRWRAELDWLLAPCSTRPLHTVDPAVRAVLRVTAYQLEHLTRVPAHAALNEAVEITRRAGEPRAARFVNAVLRKWTRTRSRIELPPRPGEHSPIDQQVAYLSVTLSHPSWLVRRWIDRVGFLNAERWCQFNNTTPDVTVRSVRGEPLERSLALIRSAGVHAAPARFVRDAIAIPPGAWSAVPSAVARDFIVQDEASQLVARTAAAREGETILDLCAAPGGKTLVLGSDQQHGRLVACDYRARRVRWLQRTLRHAGSHASVVALDALRPLPFAPAFDCVLVDVPCSGLGIVRRDPDLKWSREAEDPATFAIAQLEILEQASAVVQPAGRLVYATCSSEPEENEGVIDAFMARHPAFVTKPVAVPGGDGTPALTCARGFLGTLPFAHGLDAFFAAVLVRRR